MFGMGAAFDAYAVHKQELEDIVEQVLTAVRNGEEDSLTITTSEDLSPADQQYIQDEVNRRI